MDLGLDGLEEDYATLVVGLGRDDSAKVDVSGDRHESEIRLPLYAHEARELIAVLTPLAEREDAE